MPAAAITPSLAHPDRRACARLRPGLVDDVARAAQHRTDEHAQPLRQAEDMVSVTVTRTRGAAGARSRRSRAALRPVHREPELPHATTVAHRLVGDPRSPARGLCVVSTNSAALVGKRCCCGTGRPLDVVGVQRIVAIGQRAQLHAPRSTRPRRTRTSSRPHALAAQHVGAGPRVHPQRQLVGHGPRRHVERRLLAGQRSATAPRGAWTVGSSPYEVVADLGVGHGARISASDTADRVGAQVDDVGRGGSHRVGRAGAVPPSRRSPRACRRRSRSVPWRSRDRRRPTGCARGAATSRPRGRAGGTTSRGRGSRSGTRRRPPGDRVRQRRGVEEGEVGHVTGNAHVHERVVGRRPARSEPRVLRQIAAVRAPDGVAQAPGSDHPGVVGISRKSTASTTCGPS